MIENIRRNTQRPEHFAILRYFFVMVDHVNIYGDPPKFNLVTGLESKIDTYEINSRSLYAKEKNRNCGVKYENGSDKFDVRLGMCGNTLINQ